MRSILVKATALFATMFMILGLAVVPSADAQTYPPVAPPPVQCDSVPAPSIQIIGTDIVVMFAQGSLTCIINVVVEVNPVIYDGPPPISGKLVLPLPALNGDEVSASVTAYYAQGFTRSASVAIPASALAAAQAAFAAAPASVPAAAAVPVPAQNLAFTGNEVSLPLAAGAVLVGAGGLVLLAARKREQRS